MGWFEYILNIQSKPEKKNKNYFKNESPIFYKPKISDIYGVFSLFPWIYAKHLKKGLSRENHSTLAETEQ